MTDIEQQFASNYYHWALDQWRLELAENFPLLRAAGNAEARGMIELLKPLSAPEAMRIAQALVKRTQRQAIEPLGIQLSTEEESLLRQLDERRRRTNFSAQLGAVFMRRKQSSGPRAEKRPLILQEVRRALEPTFGKLHRSGSGYYIDTGIGAWTIHTVIDLGGSFDLAYYHDIPLGPEEWRYLARLISPLSWLGVSQTFWIGLSPEEMPAAADFIALGFQRFVAAAPGILPARS